jgi:hypothetical protein
MSYHLLSCKSVTQAAVLLLTPLPLWWVCAAALENNVSFTFFQKHYSRSVSLTTPASPRQHVVINHSSPSGHSKRQNAPKRANAKKVANEGQRSTKTLPIKSSSALPIPRRLTFASTNCVSGSGQQQSAKTCPSKCLQNSSQTRLHAKVNDIHGPNIKRGRPRRVECVEYST